MPERRQDHQTATHIAEALIMKRAFGAVAGLEFLRRCGVLEELVSGALADRYERRRDPGRRLRHESILPDKRLACAASGQILLDGLG